MGDTKISALSAAAAAADANELAINEAGTSKKVTALQLKTYTNTAPIDAAGTASASTWPKMTSGTLLTTPEAGASEYDGKVFYRSPEANNRGVDLVEYFIRQHASYTLSNVGTEQQLFNAVAGGTLTLPVGTYFFECLFALTSMSGTSGNAAFSIKGGGAATLAAVLYHATGLDTGTVTNVGNLNGGISTASLMANASGVTAGTGTTMHAMIQGTFEITGAGTIIPSITLVNAAAAVVAAGSYFRCRNMGTNGVLSVGRWS